MDSPQDIPPLCNSSLPCCDAQCHNVCSSKTVGPSAASVLDIGPSAMVGEMGALGNNDHFGKAVECSCAISPDV
eukprot:12398027-Karenia_brevis.AAC.1